MHNAVFRILLPDITLRKASIIHCATGNYGGDDEARQICSKAEADFLEEHLLGWAPELLNRLASQSSSEFYEISSRLLILFLETVAPQGETIGSDMH